MTSNEVTPTRSSTKRSSLSSSASQPRTSVHFDLKTLISHPETIDSSLKKRLSLVASQSPYKSSSPETHRDDHQHHKTPRTRRQSIVLSPTKLSVASSYPKIDLTPEKNESPRRRRPSIVLPLTTVSVPDITQSIPISPLKRRYSTISPPLHDSIHHTGTLPPSSPRKRRFSGIISSEDNTQHDPSTRTRTRVLCTIPPSANKPPPKVCAQVNQRIRSTFHYPDFDFIQHVQHRSYIVRSQHFEDSECVTMLDTGVDNLLQRMFNNLPSQPDTSMNVDIKPSPGKGLGMFSRKEIQSGKTFLVEYPTIITPYVIGLSGGLSALYADIFGRLSSPVFGEIMDLSASGETKDVHEAIMRINALAIELPVPGGEFSELNTHRAIFLQTSRCNHSCGPNARWEWDLNRFSLVLTAVRPIKEGEEITIPYIAPNMSNKDRQDILSNFYGFNCLCPFCTLPEDNIRQSDLARSTLASTWSYKGNFESIPSAPPPPPLLPSFEKWCLDPTFPDDILINAHLRALHSIEREGLEISVKKSSSSVRPDHHHHPARDIGRHLDAIAMCYGALEDTENFRMWMERVSEVRLRSRPEQKLVFHKWLLNPMSFPVWGWRRVFCGQEGDGEDDSGSGSSDTGLSACVRMGMFEYWS